MKGRMGAAEIHKRHASRDQCEGDGLRERESIGHTLT